MTIVLGAIAVWSGLLGLGALACSGATLKRLGNPWLAAVGYLLMLLALTAFLLLCLVLAIQRMLGWG